MKLLSNRASRLDTTALRKMSLSSALFLLAGLISCMGQGTLRITFDGPPEQPPGTDYLVADYTEGGFLFMPLLEPYTPGSGLDRNGGGNSGFPENGTAYLQWDWAGLAFSSTDDSPFGLASVDLADSSTYLVGFKVSFLGYRPDGSTISTTFSGSGIEFQTFNFDDEWAFGLVRVEVPTPTDLSSPLGWSMDNLVIAVPEPASGALLTCGAFAAMLLRKKRRTG